ncbi:MAG TPA: hypothetical protein VHF65_05310, partial [Nitrososphaera sp.]|nr:hypothetical protein [Nitrososphaera sp.]
MIIELRKNRKIVAPLLALPLVLATIMGTTILLPFQPLNAQNATAQMENATATDDQSVEVTVLETLAQPGFGNTLEVTDSEGNPIPISYNIVGGRAFAMVGDPARHALFVLLDPGLDGGSLEIDLPRNVLDSKASDGSDSRFVVTVDGQQISGEPTGICIGDCPNIWNSFKETETTETDRVLTVIFGPQNRVIEIVGNAGTIFG